MKNLKIMYSLCFLCFLFFQNKTVKAEKFLDPIYENVEGYYGSIDNLALKMDLSCKFTTLFDEVGSINVFYANNVGYFYEVYGFKNGVPTINNLKVNLEDVINEEYSYINFEKINNDWPCEEYCYEPVNPDNPFCQPNNYCTYFPFDRNCPIVICGCFDLIGGEIPYCHIP